ncbi:hypothetical protein SFOMI_2758 [Sphingobium fuliginis]|uniref:Uncharacterized protein n=1 Tax=Sphingobium fuliginis (strain ATCC 27551) TaxID=336203 RepID=A0A292ZH82_SPHSA|nr:hypothetical protein SFOMI_2758 [Sphingobium fuliginis]
MSNNQYIPILSVHNRRLTDWREYSNRPSILDAVGNLSIIAKALGGEP